MVEEKAKQIFAILQAVYGQSPWTLSQILADLTKPGSDYYYAYADKQMVGFLALQDLAGEMEITNLAIHPDYQRQGLADRLLGHLTAYDEPVFLEVRASNLPAQRLYQKQGFVISGKRRDYYRNPIEDALIMERK